MTDHEHSHGQHTHSHHAPGVPDHHQHDHHQHHHDGSRWHRIRHFASHLIGAHSHDPADQVDDALEANERGRRALWISLLALAITSILQAFVVLLTGSVALLGDTLHNVADAATAIPLLFAFWLARRPANDRFTSGYGRAEDLAGVFVVAMIALSCLLTAWQAIDRLIHPQDVKVVWAVAAAGVIGFLGNELVARYRIRVGRQIGSAALIADGLHARTDGFTSLAVVLSALGIAAGLPWADPVIGLLIAVAIVGVLRSAVAQVGARLMDAVDPHLVEAARTAVLGVEGVHAIERLRLRWIGHALHATVDVVVDRAITLERADEIAHAVEPKLRSALPRLGEAVVHTCPRLPVH